MDIKLKLYLAKKMHGIDRITKITDATICCMSILDDYMTTKGSILSVIKDMIEKYNIDIEDPVKEIADVDTAAQIQAYESPHTVVKLTPTKLKSLAYEEAEKIMNEARKELIEDSEVAELMKAQQTDQVTKKIDMKFLKKALDKYLLGEILGKAKDDISKTLLHDSYELLVDSLIDIAVLVRSEMTK